MGIKQVRKITDNPMETGMKEQEKIMGENHAMPKQMGKRSI